MQRYSGFGEGETIDFRLSYVFDFQFTKMP